MDDRKLVPDEARDAFRAGYDIGFEAVGRCHREIESGNEETKGAMTGLVASVLEALFTIAPSYEVADMLVKGCSAIGKKRAAENRVEMDLVLQVDAGELIH